MKGDKNELIEELKKVIRDSASSHFFEVEEMNIWITSSGRIQIHVRLEELVMKKERRTRRIAS